MCLLANQIYHDTFFYSTQVKISKYQIKCFLSQNKSTKAIQLFSISLCPQKCMRLLNALLVAGSILWDTLFYIQCFLMYSTRTQQFLELIPRLMRNVDCCSIVRTDLFKLQHNSANFGYLNFGTHFYSQERKPKYCCKYQHSVMMNNRN